MSHGHPGFLKTYEETKTWLDIYAPNNTAGFYKIYPDTLEVDVFGSLILQHIYIEYIPVKFKNVSHIFRCVCNTNLLSLKGSPDTVRKGVLIADLPCITTLQHLPKSREYDIINCTSLVTSAYDSSLGILNSKGFREPDTQTKVSFYKDWLSKVSTADKIESLDWLRKNDFETYIEIAPYLIQITKQFNYKLGLSEDVLQIASIALEGNHRV